MVALSKDILGNDEESISTDDIDILNMMILVKDQYNVSGRAYHEMARICKEMPRHYRIKERIGELNKLWNIRPTPHGTLGVQQTLQDRLKVRIAKLLQVLPDSAPLKMYKRISVKLSGDGTCIGKRLNVINFTFTILDEGSAAYSAEGNHPLVIYLKRRRII